ncbi:MAG: hypothetical protein VYA34_16205 [Myxococcota bacterium]|nr:hypothetical protein [Myxococcota bacterium]
MVNGIQLRWIGLSRRFSLAFTFFLLIGPLSCGSRGLVPDQPSEESVVEVVYSVETYSEKEKIEAGTLVTVVCVVTSNESENADVEVLVELSPTVEDFVQNGVVATFTPKKMGNYSATCRIKSEAIADPSPLEITVVPAPLHSIETKIEKTMVSAGIDVDIHCLGFDVFGNEISNMGLMGTYSDLDFEVYEDVGVDEKVLSSKLRFSSKTGGLFKVHGTQRGEFLVGCRFGYKVSELVEAAVQVDETQPVITDLSPLRITVQPGEPYQTVTSLDKSLRHAGEPVTVTCRVKDLFDNEIADVDTEVSVLAADWSHPVFTGAVVSGHEIRIVRSGSYYVFCFVPGQIAGDESPEILEVKPGKIDSVRVDLLDFDCYKQGARLPLTVFAYDSFSNYIEAPDYQWCVKQGNGPSTCESALSHETIGVSGHPDTGLYFTHPGEYTIRIEIPLDAQTQNVGPYEQLITVDSSPPNILLESVGDLEASNLPDLATLDGRRTGIYVRQGSSDGSSGCSSSGSGSGGCNIGYKVRVEDGESAIGSVWLDEVRQSSVVLQGQTENENGWGLDLVSGHDSRWGFNLISVSASDICGNKTSRRYPLLRSADFRSASILTPGLEPDSLSPLADGEIPKGLSVRLNQPGLDDGKRKESDSFGELDDIASILQYLLQGADIGTLITGQIGQESSGDELDLFPVTAEDKAKIKNCNETSGLSGAVVAVKMDPTDPTRADASLTGVSVDSFTVEDDGRIHFGIGLGKLEVNVEAHACLMFDGQPILPEVVDGTIIVQGLSFQGELELNTNEIMDAGILTGEYESYLSLVTSSILLKWSVVDLNLVFQNNPTFNELFEGVFESVKAALEAPIQEALINVIADLMPELSKTFLSGFSFGTSFALPEPLSGELLLATALRGGAFEVIESTGLNISFDAQISPGHKAEHVPNSAPGSIYRQAQGASFSNVYPFGVMLMDNLVNQALWALWHQGTLKIDNLGSLLSTTGEASSESSVELTPSTDVGCLRPLEFKDIITLNFESLLPPLLMPGKQSSGIELGWGDIMLSGNLNLSHAASMALSSQSYDCDNSDLESVPFQLLVSFKGGVIIEPSSDFSGLEMRFLDSPKVWVEVWEFGGEGHKDEVSDLFEKALGLLLPRVLGGFLQNIPIPTIPLTGVGTEEAPVDGRLKLDGFSVKRLPDGLRLMGGLAFE